MLDIEGVSIRLGAFSLCEVNLRVEKGQYLCLAGPTGAGKTILLECIAGLHRPDRGTICLCGQEVTALPPEARGLGYVPQDYALFPHMTVFENIAYGLRERGIGGAKLDRRVRAAAETMQVEYLLERGIVNLSGGKRQRTAFARALVLNCNFLLLDESLSALDVVTTKELSLQLAELHRQLGLTVIHVTHDFDEAFNLATHIAICHAGRLLQTGPVREVFTRPASRTVASFLGLVNIFPHQGRRADECPVASRLPELAHSASDGRCACLPPDQIVLRRDGAPTSGLSFQGRVRDVRWFGPIYEATVDIGVMLTATLSRQEQDALRLRAGDRVQASIDSRAIHVLDDR